MSAQRIAKAAIERLGADEVNLLNCCGADAWQSAFHFHLHGVPRYIDKATDRLVWCRRHRKFPAIGTRSRCWVIACRRSELRGLGHVGQRGVPAPRRTGDRRLDRRSPVATANGFHC
ncbi:HIT domain-containing protein [Rhodococcus artemisiae]|uniref:HIT domain-containing protein n=2 Tax=Rhodococcus artemisiae TaxID=714159 RepID=A0ABU7L3B0_9NOCA|nr:HIT domain-containing protein [Rhodococcus artemisiae]